MLSPYWRDIVDIVDYAFQPIINTFTGVTYAVEALLRGVEEVGFSSIGDFFDEAYKEGILFPLDIELRRKAIYKFVFIKSYKKLKLFYNYDPRIQLMHDYQSGLSDQILNGVGLVNSDLCFELSERHRFDHTNGIRYFLENAKMRGFNIALDDFGVGFSSLELLYHSEPDYLKFDRFLISCINSDIKKKSFCSHLISMAKVFGVIVIAEGVEKEREFNTCREIGFDLIQGYYIQRPTVAVDEIQPISDHIVSLNSTNKRMENTDAELIVREIASLETVRVEDSMSTLFEKFHHNSLTSFFPVLDSSGFPLGIIHERNIKKYIYSPYGYDLFRNKSVATSLKKFLIKCPVVDVNTSQEKILEIFVSNPDSDGVIITRNMQYFGFLNSRSLLNIINEKNLAFAREANPLTKLPGNTLIMQYIQDTMMLTEGVRYLVYIDFDNFKPFNDRFGFRQGDRVIILFAEILRKEFDSRSSFIGHVGGDDFFVGIEKPNACRAEIIAWIKRIIEKFTDSVASFYDTEEFSKGFYTSTDRKGKTMRLPLLSASAAIMQITPNDFMKSGYSQDDIVSKLTLLKNASKKSEEKIIFCHLSNTESTFVN